MAISGFLECRVLCHLLLVQPALVECLLRAATGALGVNRAKPLPQRPSPLKQLRDVASVGRG